MEYLYFDEIDSTNSYLKREYQNLKDSTLVFAGHQTSGKGRMGRKWEDDSDSLLFSILLKKDLNPSRSDLLSLLCGVALHKTLEEYHIPSLIKWPNDVLVHEKKVAGILLEGVVQDSLKAIIIGMGINVNTKNFPSDLQGKATSLFLETNTEFDKVVFLKKFVDKFEYYYSRYLLKDDVFLDVLRQNSYLDGKQVFFNYYGENRHCVVKGISREGNLLVEDEHGLCQVKSGEVTLEKSYHQH